MIQFKDVIELDLALIQTANERKQAEEALCQSEEKFRSLADTAKVAISIVADASGVKYLYVNLTHKKTSSFPSLHTTSKALLMRSWGLVNY